MVFFIGGTERNNFARDIGVNPLLDLLQPFILLIQKIFLWQVNQIHNRFSSNKTMGIKQNNLFHMPFSISHPFPLFEHIFNFY